MYTNGNWNSKKHAEIWFLFGYTELFPPSSAILGSSLHRRICNGRPCNSIICPNIFSLFFFFFFLNLLTWKKEAFHFLAKSNTSSASSSKLHGTLQRPNAHLMTHKSIVSLLFNMMIIMMMRQMTLQHSVVMMVMMNKINKTQLFYRVNI